MVVCCVGDSKDVICDRQWSADDQINNGRTHSLPIRKNQAVTKRPDKISQTILLQISFWRHEEFPFMKQWKTVDGRRASNQEKSGGHKQTRQENQTLLKQNFIRFPLASYEFQNQRNVQKLHLEIVYNE